MCATARHEVRSGPPAVPGPAAPGLVAAGLVAAGLVAAGLVAAGLAAPASLPPAVVAACDCLAAGAPCLVGVLTTVFVTGSWSEPSDSTEPTRELAPP